MRACPRSSASLQVELTEGLAYRHLRLPPAFRGQRVGLFGGSFNPPHEGHVHVSEIALARLGLDRLWWLVTPGNPLKSHDELRPLAERVALCEAITAHPRIAVTAFEAAVSTRYTADTLAEVRRRRPGVRFVWVMGADNLAGFHRWERWREIAAAIPVAVVDRPGSTLSHTGAPAAVALARARVDESDARLLPFMDPPAWTFLHGPRSSLSSTAIRAKLRAFHNKAPFVAERSHS